MQIEITSRHVPVEEGEKAFIREKLTQLEHVWHRNLSVRVVIEFEKYVYRVELIIHAGHQQISVTEKGRGLYPVVDKAVKVAQRRLRKLKGKIEEGQKRRRQLYVSELQEGVGAEAISELRGSRDLEIEEMLRPAAIAKLKESGRNFLIYQDLEMEGLAIVYRRKAGALGFIEL